MMTVIMDGVDVDNIFILVQGPFLVPPAGLARRTAQVLHLQGLLGPLQLTILQNQRMRAAPPKPLLITMKSWHN